ncbi:apolipoprotein Eb [Leuresthes tenuis]|uniref:apolipoprotein Eb n=1 Tax=Leuresthes tenuis TaxID=355514 RepID=UPI003B5038A1
MKAVALILALAVITGCNARAVRQADTSLTRLESSVDRFWQHISELNQKADGMVENIKASQLSRELDTLITDTMAELATYRQDIHTKLAPFAVSSTNQLAEDLELLANKLQKDMTDAKERSTEYLGELKTMVEQNTEDVRNRVNTYTNKLRKRLTKDTEEIRDTVTTYLGELQSRTSQNLGAVKEQVVPYVQQASDTATQKLSDISSILETQADTIKTELESRMKELRTSMDSRLDEITDLLSPIAIKIREHFEEVVDKVKTATA